ncbi:MAG: universal stress protein [Planctomycetes bacterium]|nr:universal stress protein [Planctomycetota bacterium]
MAWLPKQVVVVPVDFSEESFAAIDTALELVADASHVHVIHVLPALEAMEPGVIWNSIDDNSRRRHAEQALRERLTDAKYAQLNLHIAFGDPGHGVADFAQQKHAELIVLPSHGRRGISRLLIGSTAERVVRMAHCPVLVLRK